MKKKRILILGAGNAQIDAIEYCKEHGYEVVGCSYTTVDAGIPHLDYFEQIDIKDIDGVMKLARKNDVCAIYSIGSDLAIPSAMRASEMLRLPHFITHVAAETCHSKHLMREALGRDFEGNASFIVCDNLNEAMKYDAFPAMMKPVDSQGQRGCYKVESKTDIEKHFTDSINYSVTGKVIIEDYIDGPEISINTYMQEGEMRIAVISDRYSFEEYPGGIIKKHIVPSSFADEYTREKSIDVCRKAAKKLGITNGPCYFQIKLRGGKKPIILEIAPRLDGCHMWNLIKHYCGADLLDACFGHLLDGRQVLTDKYRLPNEECCLEFISELPNTTFMREKHDVSDAVFVCWYYEDGDRVLKVNGIMEKCGYVIKKTGKMVR